MADAALGADLGRKHRVDVRALLVRLSRLDLAQTVALVDRLEEARAGGKADGAGADCAEAEAEVIAFPRRR